MGPMHKQSRSVDRHSLHAILYLKWHCHARFTESRLGFVLVLVGSEGERIQDVPAGLPAYVEA